jgi:hypothetical protein
MSTGFPNTLRIVGFGISIELGMCPVILYRRDASALYVVK